jgi:hypothetical protein
MQSMLVSNEDCGKVIILELMDDEVQFFKELESVDPLRRGVNPAGSTVCHRILMGSRGHFFGSTI